MKNLGIAVVVLGLIGNLALAQGQTRTLTVSLSTTAGTPVPVAFSDRKSVV